LNIPEWHSLERAYTNPQDTEFVLSLFEKLDKQWQPWLARLIFTGVALSEDSEKFLNLRRTLNPVVYASAEKENGLNLLPAELDGLLEEDTTGSTASATNKRTIPSFRMPSPIIKPKLDKLEIVFSGTPGTYPLLTDDPISVRLRDSGRSDSGNVPFLITHRPWREVRYIQGDPAQEQIAERKVPVTWRRAFEGALPGGQLKRSRSVPVVLEVQEGLSFLPWEALTVGNVAIPLQQGVLTRRITKNWSQEPRQTAAPLALLACDPSLDELRKLFDPLREKNLLNEVVRLDLEALGNPEALRRLSGPPGIVQLVGSGRIVNETPRLLLGQRRPAYISDSNPAIPQIKAAPNITPAYTITSLPGRDIARLFPSARLVILQGQPVDNPNWTRDCGAQAAYLRAIAEDVFKAGVPAVLTVPPMTIADGERFGANLLRRLAEVDWQRSGDNGIVEAVSEARRELARQREQTVRSALDVCLYADIGPRSVLFEDKKVL
jgi:hypothetical protein